MHLKLSIFALCFVPHFASADGPTSQPLTRLEPISIAPIYHINGQIQIGEAVPVSAIMPAMTGLALAFDQFQGDQVSPADFAPVEANLSPCFAASPENRFIFGSTARNVHFVGDFSGAAAGSIGKPIHTVAFAWYWNPPGASQQNPSAEFLTIDLDFWQEFNSACDLSWVLSPGSITAARTHIAGVRLYYNQPGTPGGHYSVVDISTFNFPPMTSQSGAVEWKFLKLPPNSTAIPLPTDYSTRAQPFLWGTAADVSPPPYLGQPRPGGPGNVQQWNDNAAQTTAIVDGVFAAGECENWAFPGLCYNPVGPMIAWFYQICQTHPAFSLTYPGNNYFEIPREATFTWDGSQSPPGTTYHFEIRREGDDSLIFEADGLTQPSVQIPPGFLYYCEYYRWRVTALADAACPPAISDAWIFRAEANIAGDFNGDMVVDFFDYLDFVDAFSTGSPEGDYNHDSIIDFFDYLDFVDVFSQGC